MHKSHLKLRINKGTWESSSVSNKEIKEVEKRNNRIRYETLYDYLMIFFPHHLHKIFFLSFLSYLLKGISNYQNVQAKISFNLEWSLTKFLV